MITMVPSNNMAKVNVSSRMVPSVNGLFFFPPKLAAIAMGATIGRDRLNSMTSPVAMSHGRLVGAGVGLLLKPQVSPSPSKPEPLLAEADENSYAISLNPCAPGLLSAFVPHAVAENSPVGPRIMMG